MAKQAVARTADLEPIDRLEEKIKLLVGMVASLRADQTKAADENAFLESHSWEDYAEWFLGLTEGASEDTKARYAFVYGDFRRVHRTGLIACQYRAAEWRHKDVELAAHDLLQHLDGKRT